MDEPACDALRAFLGSNDRNPSVQALVDALAQETTARDGIAGPDDLIRIYEQALPLLESAMRASDYSDPTVALYQRVFRELETLLQARPADDRHDFVIVIPVADRPLHVEACLGSLLDLCRCFGYGGLADGRYGKVMAVIADDSKDEASIARNRAIAEHFTGQGLQTLYFGLEQQLQQIDQLGNKELDSLEHVLGRIDRTAFYHKGPSVMRNIAYLMLKDISGDGRRRLFYFIDSDQEFKVKISTGAGDRDVYITNYLYHLDRIFANNHVSVLTGKVVGDPPVSPSVMAGTFLDDVIGFLGRIGETQPLAPCSFHGHVQQADAGAAYHDMVGLFGFEKRNACYDYHCTLEGTHDHARCFADFARRLNRFFDGEHPTRLTYFDPQQGAEDTQPARTIYTGNYVLRPEALKYFVPFATLRLRMAGPVLGRIIRAEIGDSFVSANLPMLHKRTVAETGSAEFRPGIAKTADAVDLSGEFERQFFGDVMLFTVEKLASMGYPRDCVSEAAVKEALDDTASTMLQRYRDKHAEIRAKLDSLRTAFENPECWWHEHTALARAREDFRRFIDNIERNFGNDAVTYGLIESEENRSRHLARIRRAIMAYAGDRAAWEAVLAASPRH